MSLRQRSVFLLCDGSRSVEAVLTATAAVAATEADVEHLLAQGFLCAIVEAVPVAPVSVAVPAVPAVAEAPMTAAGKRPLFSENWTMF